MKSFVSLSLTLFSLASIATAQVPSSDEKAIRTLIQNMEDGWNAKNGKQFASSFAEKHDYIVWTGLYFREQDQEANARAHQGIFDSFYKTTDVHMVVDKIRHIREDLALVHLFGATYDTNAEAPKDPKVIISMLVEKQNSEWKIISFHNCDIELSFEPGAQNGSPVPPQVMYKSWYADAGQ